MTAGERFGAWRQPGGDHVFRLWAPAAQSVELLLDGEALPNVMRKVVAHGLGE